MNRTLASLFVFALFLTQTPLSFAQEAASPDTPPAVAENEPASAGLLNCSDYYRFGSVSVELEPTVQTTVPGSLMTFAGVIKNDNVYPLLDGTLYVKIFKRNNRTFQAGDGNEVVDQFVAKDNLTLRANGALDTTFTWKVPMNAEGGEYYAAYFYTTSKRYNLAGISYTDDVVGDQGSFTIRNDAGTVVAKLSKLDTTLNAQDYFFKAALDRFGASETVTVETTIINPTDKEKRLPLQWSQYSWDSLHPDNLRHTKTELVTVPANSKKTISYEVRPQPESTIYVTAVTLDNDVKSILNVRYTREGIEEASLNFSGLSAFPLSKDAEATLFACAQATTEETVPGNTVTLSLKDKDGKVLHEYRYEGTIASARSGFGERFTPTTNINYATLTTTLERNGAVVEEVTQVYDCEAIDPTSCLPEEGLSGFLDFLKTYFMQILLIIVIVLLIGAIMIYLKKRPRRENINAMGGPGVTPLLLLFTLIAGFVAFASTASAQQGPCILGPEEEVGGQDGFVDQRGGSACIASNYIEPPSGGPNDHQSGSFYGACYGLGEGDRSTVGGCISRVRSFRSAGAPSDGCTVYGHYCEQGVGAGSCGPIGYDATSFPEYNDRIQQCRDLGYTQEMFNNIEEQGDIGNAMRSTGCLVNWERDAGFGQAHYEKPSCVAPPTGGSCSVAEILNSGEAYPRDCYSYEQGGNLGLAVCRGNYTSVGDSVTNQTDISNGRCVVGENLPIPSGGTCSWTQVTLDPACSGSAAPGGASCTLPSGPTTDQIIDTCAGTAQGGYSRPADFQNAYVVKSPDDGTIVCHNNDQIETYSCSEGTFAWSGQPICQGSFPACTSSSCTQEFNSAQWYTGGTSELLSIEGLSQPNNCEADATLGGYTHWNRRVVHDARQADPYVTSCYGVSNPTGTESKPQSIRYEDGGTVAITTGYDSGSSCTAAPADPIVTCGDQSEFWGGGMNCQDSSAVFVTCGPNQKIEYDTEETYRSCPGFPNAGHTGYIGRCVPDVSCQAGNGAPATPTITGPTSGVVNAVPPYTFTVSAEDPERNNLRYGISDASCSTVYEWLPGNGVVPSNTAQSFDRTFTADGSYTFYVLAEDEAFARSSCAEHTIIISPAPAPAADLKLDGSDGPLDVGKNTQHTLTWTSANAASCTLFGEGMGNLGTTVTATGTMSVTISQSNSFTMSCSGAPDEVVVNVVNQAPEAPAVSHPTGNAPFDTLTTFNIQGNDPDGDDVFYEVDWDLTDNIDFNTTTGGGVNNSIQMASRAFAASGPQRIRARTVDVPGGLRSGWTEYTITIDTAPAPIATLEAAVNGGSFSSDDQTVNPGDTVTMLWDSQNASSCSGSGSGFDTGSARSGADAVNTPAANSQTTFTARCDGPGGSGSESLIITTRQLPNLSRPNITSQLSSSFDLATGYYDYVDITFNTQNTGGSDTRASADYEFKFDNGRDGYEYSRNGSLGLFTVLQTVGRTERVAGPIEFGNSLAYVAADIPLSSDGVVEETDEDDNDREVLITFLPPDPGLSITAERTQLREGEATRINWSRRASYPLDCTVTGPNVLVDNAPREGQRPTAAIMAKSVFTYTCIEPITGTQFSDSVSVETTGSIEET